MEYRNLYGTERISPPRATSPSKSYYPPRTVYPATSYQTASNANRSADTSYFPKSGYESTYDSSYDREPSYHPTSSFYPSSRYEGSMTRSLSKPILPPPSILKKSPPFSKFSQKDDQTSLRIDVSGGEGLSDDDVQTLLYLIIKNKLIDDNFSVDHLYDHSYLVTFDLLEDAQYILDEYDGMDFTVIKLNIYF